jgi:hypothetical protein
MQAHWGGIPSPITARLWQPTDRTAHGLTTDPGLEREARKRITAYAAITQKYGRTLYFWSVLANDTRRHWGKRLYYRPAVPAQTGL